ncbi:phosphatidylglycerol lysyltransferase domain-containing protein [Streptomyces cadmiisoli]|uniref:phosphatidylglycerol lysyltransferase domain-containing protein n=1 Tax=Streptomyces cadmiisoli TaxID=2184053 RepID=UPI0036480D0A
MQSAHDTLAAHGDNPSSFLALNSGNEYFHDDRIAGTCAYRRSGRYTLQFGGPFCAPQHRERLLESFVAHTGRRLVAGQLHCNDAELYLRSGFTVNQIGASYAVDLSRFTLRGKRFVRLRNKISRARREGLEVAELAHDDDCGELDRLDRHWLRDKGRHGKELRFLVGQRGGPLQRHRRLFVGRIAGTAVGYINYAPVYGRIAGQQGLTKTIGSMVLGQVPVLPGAPDARVDMIPQDYVTKAIGDLVRGGVCDGEFWLTAGKEAPLLREITDVCGEFAVRSGLPRPHRPRLIPVDAVLRLLLPLLEGTSLPESVRRRFQHYAELLLVFQSELPFDSSLGEPHCGTRPTHSEIRSALVRNLESWAAEHPGLLRRHRVRPVIPTEAAS